MHFRNPFDSIGKIVNRLHVRQPQASKHLRVLHESGVIEFVAVANANRRIYQLRPEPFRELVVWLKEYREIWESKFENLDRYLQDLQKNESKSE
ncbi:hypothetical protein CJP46_07315 [Paenibacillus sp. XY044]|nr:hypothetical protein CJP46_07315 [Paenibacillus sp. XY044]